MGRVEEARKGRLQVSQLIDMSCHGHQRFSSCHGTLLISPAMGIGSTECVSMDWSAMISNGYHGQQNSSARQNAGHC